jgi:integrator complex subunit 6
MLRNSASISQVTDFLLNQIAPPRPFLPLPEPIRSQTHQVPSVGSNGTFVSGGPVCCFQALEPDIDSGQAPSKYRAMLLYVPHQQLQPSGGQNIVDPNDMYQPPTWCIPESFFPSKKLDTLPPRPAQPEPLRRPNHRQKSSLSE